MTVDRLKRDLLNKLINARIDGRVPAVEEGKRVYVSQRKRTSA